MAGTDKTKEPRLGGPAVVLIGPQLGENIGMAARAMLNCGLTDLRLVAPRDGWPNPAARAAAAGADGVLENARIFEDARAAIADCHQAYAATARPRELIKTVLTPAAAARRMRAEAASGQSLAILFGTEKAGLSNEEIALCDGVIEVPLNPAFKSLNLAQAVLLIGWEWLEAGLEEPPERLDLGATRPATHEAVEGLMSRLVGELDKAEFFHPPDKRAAMLRNLRGLIGRLAMTEQDVKTLQGVISALIGAKRPPPPGRKGR